MLKGLSSEHHQADGFADAIEFAYRSGWSDGLPVVPATEERVTQFLDYAGLEPDEIVGRVVERDRVITAEKLAINAVMAGCLPEYMPVVVAAIEAMTDPQFKFNHLASLGSPWPLIIVNGPIAKEIGLNSGTYLFGPGSRPNATISRAVSLVLRNCAGAKTEEIQRGQVGNLIRWCGCIAENEDTAWTPLHVQRGFDKGTSTVTVTSTYPGSPAHIGVLLLGERPNRMLDAVCDSFSHCEAQNWIRGVYTLLLGPHIAEIFIREGWTKEDVRNYLVENTRASVADLKYRGAWGSTLSHFTEEMQQIQPGDESTFLHLFKHNGEYDSYMFYSSMVEGRVVDVFVVVAGGNAGNRVAHTVPYMDASNPVTRAIRVGR